MSNERLLFESGRNTVVAGFQKKPSKLLGFIRRPPDFEWRAPWSLILHATALDAKRARKLTAELGALRKSLEAHEPD